MTVWTIIHIFDLLLWLIIAFSVIYVFFFSLVSIFPLKLKSKTSHRDGEAQDLSTFLVLFPAYHEDTVIRTSVEAFLRQEYPSDHYQIVVISDHMTYETNEWLATQPITLLTPQFEKSSKARALQHAIHESRQSSLATPFTHVIILDADNIVGPDFLSRLNIECLEGHRAIQCHRTAKNDDNDIAILDGLSEEINNSIFRRGHNRVGLSSALIGSGMCFDYEWFTNHVGNLSTAGEDKELEAMLLWERVHIHYAEDIYVKDEKVSGGDNFQRQRLRWMTAQAQCLISMLPRLPHAVATFRIDYVDKTIQQALIPRSILIIATPIMAVFAQCSQFETTRFMKWWFLLLILFLAIYFAIPQSLRTRAILGRVTSLPTLAFRMIRNLLHIRLENNEFLHTTHGKKE